MGKGTRSLEEITQQAIKGGADIIQLRCKNLPQDAVLLHARILREVTRSLNALFIVNDDPGVAAACDADGVHVGQEDLSVSAARKVVGPDRLVGKSTHSKEQAVQAQEEGADYIGFGPLFATPTKPDYTAIGPEAIDGVKDLVHIPYFVIGGIDQGNCEKVLARGATRIAVVRAVVQAENIQETAMSFKKMLEPTYATS